MLGDGLGEMLGLVDMDGLIDLLGDSLGDNEMLGGLMLGDEGLGDGDRLDIEYPGLVDGEPEEYGIWLLLNEPDIEEGEDGDGDTLISSSGRITSAALLLGYPMGSIAGCSMFIIRDGLAMAPEATPASVAAKD